MHRTTTVGSPIVTHFRMGFLQQIFVMVREASGGKPPFGLAGVGCTSRKGQPRQGSYFPNFPMISSTEPPTRSFSTDPGDFHAPPSSG
eukprot:Skav234236  [mRNA]  locus=scaffold1464:433961:437013:+ [translate_table: standard]